MTIIPKLRNKFGENLGVELFINFPYLEGEGTLINTDATSGVSSFTVDNGNKFAVGEYIVVGNIGAEKSEIIRIHTSTTPTSTTITLATNSVFAHSRGDIIQSIPYDQLEIERSTDGGTTYSNLTTIDIRPDSEDTYYNHTIGASTDYYRVRFANSITSVKSQYSDGIIATGYGAGTAGDVIRKALVSMGEEIDSSILTKEFLFNALTEGRREIDENVNIQRWEFRTAFNFDAGNVIPGVNTLTLPTNLREPSTNKNVLSLRVGRDKISLFYIDKIAMNRYYRGVMETTLDGAVVTADTTIVLTSSGDFSDSGAINISAQDVDEELDVVDYTGNTLTTNTITGVTGIRTAGHATGTKVWQGASFGKPRFYTVDNGVATFDTPFSNDIAGENIWLDYYKAITDINSDADALDEPFYSIYIPYMRYRIKLRKNPSLIQDTDPDYRDWVQKREAQVNKNYSGQGLRLHIDIP